MDPLGSILGIAHVLKRAYNLYNGCASADEEIRLAADHIHTMAIVLEGVKSDLIGNRNSFVHKTTDIAKTRIQSLKIHVKHCDRALGKMEGLLNKYRGFKKGHVKLWDKFRWSTDGKKEIADAKAEVVLATSLLDLFLSKEGLSVLWKLESMMETMMKKFEALELHAPPPYPGRRARSGSNVGRTLVVTLVLARLRKALMKYRWKKNATRRANGKQPNPGPRRPKPVTRVNSGFTPNKNRNALMGNYASNIVANSTNISNNKSKPQRTRTPSPDFYYIPSNNGKKNSNSPPPRPVRRSSSMQRLMGRINAKATKPATPREHLGCWKVGVGKLAFGPKTAPQFIAHRRGQIQLRRMADIFKDAAAYDSNMLDQSDSRVKLLLKSKNDKEKKSRSGKKWFFVSGKVVARDPGKTGMVTVEKAVVILVRR